MRSILTFLLAVSVAGSAWAQKVINVVATLPDYGAIAEAIGGDKVKVTTLARGTEDPHFVDAKPSFVRVLNKADLLIEGGAELEVGWLPPLVSGARNKAILTGEKGELKLSQFVQMLDVPNGPVDRSMGDVHPFGNPHFNLDPLNGKVMAKAIADKFAALAPPNAKVFHANEQKFVQDLDRKFAEWKKQMEPLRGTKVLTYHKSFDYFLRRFGLELVGTIEPKPGIEPSPTHINQLIPRAKTEGVKYVIIEPNRPRRTPEYVSEAIGAKLLLVPALVGGNERIKTYFDLFDYNVSQFTSVH
ncbi:MAG TPA: metal ABC transporter substrate-binding protein [Verrucomicrobiae bacterium]|nr:metal ABC transporter substrate-binding protein [Verrucomicrobiae bacterium]